LQFFFLHCVAFMAGVFQWPAPVPQGERLGATWGGWTARVPAFPYGSWGFLTAPECGRPVAAWVQVSGVLGAWEVLTLWKGWGTPPTAAWVLGEEPSLQHPGRAGFVMAEEREEPGWRRVWFFSSLQTLSLSVVFFREHEKEVQNRKRGKRPRGRPRKHVVSAGGGGNAAATAPEGLWPWQAAASAWTWRGLQWALGHRGWWGHSDAGRPRVRGFGGCGGGWVGEEDVSSSWRWRRRRQKSSPAPGSCLVFRPGRVWAVRSPTRLAAEDEPIS